MRSLLHPGLVQARFTSLFILYRLQNKNIYGRCFLNSLSSIPRLWPSICSLHSEVSVISVNVPFIFLYSFIMVLRYLQLMIFQRYIHRFRFAVFLNLLTRTFIFFQVVHFHSIVCCLQLIQKYTIVACISFYITVKE